MSNFKIKPDYFDEIQWGLEHGAFQSQLGQAVVRASNLGVVDSVIEELAQSELRSLKNRQKYGDLPPFKACQLHGGDFSLGTDYYGGLCPYVMDRFTSHALIASRTGGGKTIQLLFWLIQLATNGCCIWTSDPYKTQLRSLRRLLKNFGTQLVILDSSKWKWNPLHNNLQNPFTHLSMVIDILDRLLNLSPRASHIVRQECHNLYRKFGIFEGNLLYPTLLDLYEDIKAAQGLNAAARDSILDRLGALLLSLTPKCVAWRKAWTATDLAKYSIVFERKSTPQNAYQMLLESTLFSLFLHAVEKGVYNGSLNLFVAFDDSQRFFDSRSSTSDTCGISPMDELAGIVRGVGIGLCILVQTMNGLSRRLIPNLSLKVMGVMGSHDDYATIGADLGMTPEQINWAALHLQPGSFIAQATEGNWREPFLFKAPLIRLADAVDDIEAAESVKVLDSIPTIAATEYDHWTPFECVELQPVTQPQPAQSGISEAEYRFIKAVIDNPGQPSSAYSKLAGLGVKQAVDIRQHLVDVEYLREHQVATGQRGRQAIVLEPTESAYEAVNHFEQLGGRI